MKNINSQLDEIYTPSMALLIYEGVKKNNEFFIESFMIDKDGYPVNPHPFSEREMTELSERLQTSVRARNTFLDCKGLIPEKLLWYSLGRGMAIWFTKEQQVDLFFKEELHIPSGKGHVPALVWMASKYSLSVFALQSSERPTGKTDLYRAPFFNCYSNGSVCMGNAKLSTEYASDVEEFMNKWEASFWNSYFSHLNADESPVTGNLAMLWKELIKTKKPFPVDVLKSSNKILNDLIC